ncbi:MAG: double-strand break repair protein AddB [Pseudomonadota bacterium]
MDFSGAVADGLRKRLAGEPPEAIARVTILVNTARMARRLEAALRQGGATLLPRIGLVSDLTMLLPATDWPAPGPSPLAIRLELTRLVAALLRTRPDLSPPAASFDLATGLAALLAEIAEEGLGADALERIDPGPLSEHWQRNLDFLRIATDWADRPDQTGPRAALDTLIARWRDAPPDDAIIVAGSTASRAPTRALMRAVAALPRGAVILPGLDAEMPEAAWGDLLDGDHGPGGAQDHPQYRLAAFLHDLGLSRADCPRWGHTLPAAPARNRLVSLALRPAPATDAWRREGPALTDLPAACAGLTLLEAPSPAEEAAAIATGLRGALRAGQRAALITPDRNLARQVTAHLDRWGIIPDDSAGRPLVQSAPGRLLTLSAELRGRPLEAEGLVALLKHPLTHSGGARAAHLRRARQMECDLLRRGPCPFPDRARFEGWDEARDEWSAWLGALLDRIAGQPAEATLAAHLEAHQALVDALATGSAPQDEATHGLWADEAGRAASRVLRGLSEAAFARGEEPISAADYARVLRALLSEEEVRETFRPHPDVMIWGALEARVRTADLVILGGLNDGTWPEQPSPDPWLNRAMRDAAGLRLPDRVIGLSAHDFEQAIAGPRVWLSRAIRDGEADTVPSRWLNRITGLLGGLGGAAGQQLDAMRERGQVWLRRAAMLDAPDRRHNTAKAPRPAPAPPVSARPTRISVTQVERLIRDPYAIYARAVLGLSPLDPLRQAPDARQRGIALHGAMERFADAQLGPETAAHLAALLEEEMQRTTPWPGQRSLWRGAFGRALPDLLTAETARRATGRPLTEVKGALDLVDPPVTLVARADRMDLRDDSIAIYDYKTGAPPSAKQQRVFAKQLSLEAMMVSEGAFDGLPDRPVQEVAYLRIGSQYDEVGLKTADLDPVALRTELSDLLRRFTTDAPYTARLLPAYLADRGEYDDLSRLGEWDETQRARLQDVGHG